MDRRLKYWVRRLAVCLRDDSGGSAVEFGLIGPVVIFVTFAVLEGGLAAWQWNAVEKAAQMGVRAAIVAEPVAGSVKTFDCNSGIMQAGEACTNPSAATFPTVTCTSVSCSDGSTPDALAFSTIGDAIRVGYPFIDDSNIVIEYRDSKLGFAGRPGVIPIVEVRLTGVPYNLLVLDLLRPLIFAPGSVPDQITMPDATATLSGEDMAFKF